jgi:hypothetical protein
MVHKNEPNRLPPLYAELIREILRNDIRDFTFMIDKSDVPRNLESSIHPDEMREVLSDIIGVLDIKERVTIVNVRPNLDDPIQGEQM